MLVRAEAYFPEALDFLAGREILELVELAHLDFGLAAVDRRVGEALGPLDRFLARLRLDDGVAGDKLFRLGERAVDHRALLAVVLDAPAFRARLEARRIDEHAGLLQLLMVLAHLGEQAL